MAARTRGLVALLLALAAFFAGAVVFAQERPRVVAIPVTGMVDLGMSPFVERALEDAESRGADAVVLDIDTHGGRLDAAVQIRDRVLASRIRTVAFVHPRAISAGALIALAADEIAVSDGATIGAATPVALQPGGGSVAADEKTVSYLRKEFRATAEQNGHPPELAEAMVDPDVDVPGIAPPGKLLTLTGSEALSLGVAERHAQGLPELLEELGLEGADLQTSEPNWAERAVGIVTNPIVASLLMSLAFIGLFVEMRTPGFGVPGLVGIACLVLLLGGHWIAQLAGLEELLLVGIGFVLLAFEIFAIPGFGLVGIAGIVAIAAGLGMTFIGEGATPTAILASIARVIVAFLVATAVLLALVPLLRRTRLARGIVLDAGGPELREPEPPRWVGATGQAITPLRPAGTAMLDGHRVDVVTEGEFIAPGEKVQAIVQEGARVVVRRLEPVARERAT